MKLKFLYSQNKEKEKLLGLFDEYQWFIDNDFPIALPKFYHNIYKKNKKNKNLFNKEISLELNRIYNKKDYQAKKKEIKKNWQKIEVNFFDIFDDFIPSIRDAYLCQISLYGPEGQFQYPNTINMRAKYKKDIKNSNETIVHELIHLLIYTKTKQLKLNYAQIEGIVDLFFTETELQSIFPKYKLQDSILHDKKIFQKIKKRNQC